MIITRGDDYRGRGGGVYTTEGRAPGYRNGRPTPQTPRSATEIKAAKAKRKQARNARRNAR